VDVNGGPIMTLADASDARGGSWSKAGQILYTPNFLGPVHLISADGGPSRPVTVIDEDRNESTHRYPFFLPDGRHFLFLARQTGAGSGKEPTNFAGDIDSDERTKVVSVASNPVYAAGHLLFTQEYSLMAQPFDPVSLKTTGPARPLVPQLRFDRRFSLGVFSASATLLAYQTGEGEKSLLSIYDRSGKLIRDLGDPSEYLGLAVSPEGRRVAFALLDPGSGAGDIWMQDLEDDLRTRISFGTNDEFSPQWHKDGNEIFFAGSDETKGTLFSKSLSGRASQREITSLAIGSNVTSIGTDYIIYDVEDGTRQAINAVPLNGDGETLTVGRANDSGPGSTWGGRLSPDGRWLGYASDATGRAEVYIMPFPEGGGRWQVSTSGGEEIAWRADGKEMFYLGLDGAMMAAEIRAGEDSLQVGAVRRLFRVPTATTPGVRFDVFPDGQSFVLNRSLLSSEDVPVTLLLNWTSLLEDR
jgi:Tol biopolymer transport system component